MSETRFRVWDLCLDYHEWKLSGSLHTITGCEEESIDEVKEIEK